MAAVIRVLFVESTDTIVIGVILLASVGLGFVNEYRAERATEALHFQVTHRPVTLRGGSPVPVDVTGLVPGDIVRLALGEVVPADVRLVSTTGLECDESVLTGESLPAAKAVPPVAAGSALGDLTSCAFRHRGDRRARSPRWSSVSRSPCRRSRRAGADTTIASTVAPPASASRPPFVTDTGSGGQRICGHDTEPSGAARAKRRAEALGASVALPRPGAVSRPLPVSWGPLGT